MLENGDGVDDILGIPLLVKLPGQISPQLHESSARTIDILATIADVLDADLPWTIDGRSLFGRNTSRPETVVIHRNDGRPPRKGQPGSRRKWS